MRIAIVDDHQMIHDQFKTYLPDYQLSCFLSETDFIDQLQQTRFDVIFLDLCLPNEMGYELGNRVRQSPINAFSHIVYFSSSTEYCLDLFASRPFTFLSKPLSETMLRQTIKQIQQSWKCQALSLKTDTTVRQIPYFDIVFLESQRAKIIIHRRDSQTIFYGKLSDLDLPTNQFLRIHQSYLVNISYILEFFPQSLTMVGGTKLTISRRYRLIVKDFLLRKEVE